MVCQRWRNLNKSYQSNINCLKVENDISFNNFKYQSNNVGKNLHVFKNLLKRCGRCINVEHIYNFSNEFLNITRLSA